MAERRASRAQDALFVPSVVSKCTRVKGGVGFDYESTTGLFVTNGRGKGGGCACCRPEQLELCTLPMVL